MADPRVLKFNTPIPEFGNASPVPLAPRGVRGGATDAVELRPPPDYRMATSINAMDMPRLNAYRQHAYGGPPVPPAPRDVPFVPERRQISLAKQPIQRGPDLGPQPQAFGGPTTMRNPAAPQLGQFNMPGDPRALARATQQASFRPPPPAPPPGVNPTETQRNFMRAFGQENPAFADAVKGFRPGNQTLEAVGDPKIKDFLTQHPVAGDQARAAFQPRLETPSVARLRGVQMGDPGAFAGASRSALAGTTAGPAAPPPAAPLRLESPSTVGLRNFQMGGNPQMLASASRDALAGTNAWTDPATLSRVPPEVAPQPRGPLSGVVGPAAAVGGMMYGANEQSKDPSSMVYRAVGHSQQGRDMLDLKSYPTTAADAGSRLLDTGIALGEMGRGVYNAAAHPIDATKGAMQSLAQAMANGYNYMQGNNERGIKRMPAGPMQIEGPMENRPAPPVTEIPGTARFALDLRDAAASAPNLPTMRQATAGARAAPPREPNAPMAQSDPRHPFWGGQSARDWTIDRNISSAIGHGDYKGASDMMDGRAHMMTGEGSRAHGLAQAGTEQQRADALSRQADAAVEQAKAQGLTAAAQLATANRAPRDTRDPMKVAGSDLFRGYLEGAARQKAAMKQQDPNADTSTIDAYIMEIFKQISGQYKHTFSTDETLQNTIDDARGGSR